MRHDLTVTVNVMASVDRRIGTSLAGPASMRWTNWGCMNSSRHGLLVAAASFVLLGAGCTSKTPSTASKPSEPTTSWTSSSATGSLSDKMASVDVAIITAMSDNTVTWVDGEIISAEVNDDTIRRLPGSEHIHTAPIAGNATFFLAIDHSGAPSVDNEGLGAAPVDQAEFANQVVGNDLNAPKIVFDDQGRVIKMSARYHP